MLRIFYLAEQVFEVYIFHGIYNEVQGLLALKSALGLICAADGAMQLMGKMHGKHMREYFKA
jgi:hypothetical protein